MCEWLSQDDISSMLVHTICWDKKQTIFLGMKISSIAKNLCINQTLLMVLQIQIFHLFFIVRHLKFLHKLNYQEVSNLDQWLPKYARWKILSRHDVNHPLLLGRNFLVDFSNISCKNNKFPSDVKDTTILIFHLSSIPITWISFVAFLSHVCSPPIGTK